MKMTLCDFFCTLKEIEISFYTILGFRIYLTDFISTGESKVFNPWSNYKKGVITEKVFKCTKQYLFTLRYDVLTKEAYS